MWTLASDILFVGCKDLHWIRIHFHSRYIHRTLFSIPLYSLIRLFHSYSLIVPLFICRSCHEDWSLGLLKSEGNIFPDHKAAEGNPYIDFIAKWHETLSSVFHNVLCHQLCPCKDLLICDTCLHHRSIQAKLTRRTYPRAATLLHVTLYFFFFSFFFLPFILSLFFFKRDTDTHIHTHYLSTCPFPVQ